MSRSVLITLLATSLLLPVAARAQTPTGDPAGTPGSADAPADEDEGTSLSDSQEGEDDLDTRPVTPSPSASEDDEDDEDDDDLEDNAPTPVAEAEEAEEEFEDVAGPYRNFRGGVLLADTYDAKDPRKRWRIIFGGYLRVQYRAVQDDPEIQFFGQNDGFVYSNARPYFAGRTPNGLGWRFQFEAAATLPRASAIQPFQEQVMRPRDAFISYEPFKLVNLQFGQFKPPFNLEELQATADILFIDRSVGNNGVSSFEGRNIPGLSVNRQVGFQASGQYYFTSEDNRPDGPGIAYSAAVTNGSNASDSFNDNDSLAYYGRASLQWGTAASIGAAGFSNNTTVINQQDNFDQQTTGYTFDISANAYGVDLLAAITNRREETDFLSDEQPEGITFTESRAYVVQAGYRIPVISVTPAYRYAYYDPTATFNQLDPQSTDVRDIDALTYHTIGLTYRGTTYPITLMLNYTLTGEQEGRMLDNDRFEGLVQITW